VARTNHFVLHTLLATEGITPSPEQTDPKLSTDATELVEVPVDDWRLGVVFPKRLARRSVTRSLLRHQAREALRRHAPAVLASGRFGVDVSGWVVRLRAHLLIAKNFQALHLKRSMPSFARSWTNSGHV
jgi:ribonuclease P protein component